MNNQKTDTDKILGLSQDEARLRLKAVGPNELSTSNSPRPLIIFFAQFKSSIVLLLIAAATLSAIQQEGMQTAGIIATLALNTGIGFVMEYRAKLSLAGLAKLAGATVRVRRQGQELDLPVREIVPGDIVILEPGSSVPADLEILECASLSVDESLLSGESLPVWKRAQNNARDKSAETILWQGTKILSGRAIGSVNATGMNTASGKLGRMVQLAEPGQTPLTKSLDQLGHQLTIAVIILSAIITLIGLLKLIPFESMLETGISLAVASVPEGLPVTATLALAAGIRRMVKAKAIVTSLPAVETLGCTTIICTDKTGTLTENKMLVTDIVQRQEHFILSGRGYEPSGNIMHLESKEKVDMEHLQTLLKAICLCNDARLERHAIGEEWHIHGDPTEGSLITAGMKLGLNQDSLQNEYPRLAEIPFDLERKRMSTIHSQPDGSYVLFLKGSPESVINRCDLSPADQEWFLGKNSELAQKGLRVLAVARKSLDCLPQSLLPEALESRLTLLGLVAMSDRPKENIQAALQTCKTAGIRIIMLTGDQSITAAAIARELAIMSPDKDEDEITTGQKLSQAKEEELKQILDRVSVIARVTPEMKLNIIKCLQQSGHVVAMTGDGVNDAPALRQANIGVVMGRSGAHISREAADLIITDDNFATIVKAIEQGRITYKNIGNATTFLLTGSMTAVIAVLLGLFCNPALFLFPLQLLYLNLIMHVFPSLGMVLQKNSGTIMSKPPRSSSSKLLGKAELIQILLRSATVAGATFIAVSMEQSLFGSQAAGKTTAFATLSLALIMQSWSWLPHQPQMNKVSFTVNRPMLICTAIDLALVAAAIYLRPLQIILNTEPLDIRHVLLVALASLSAYILSNLILRTKPFLSQNAHRIKSSPSP